MNAFLYKFNMVCYWAPDGVAARCVCALARKPADSVGTTIFKLKDYNDRYTNNVHYGEVNLAFSKIIY